MYYHVVAMSMSRGGHEQKSTFPVIDLDAYLQFFILSIQFLQIFHRHFGEIDVSRGFFFDIIHSRDQPLFSVTVLKATLHRYQWIAPWAVAGAFGHLYGSVTT